MAEIKIVTKNRRAHFEYQIGETIEAGIVLQGTEVKSIRAGKISLTDGWVDIDAAGEVYLKQVQISPYMFGNINNHEERRPRKLLLKRRDIVRLDEAISTRGYSLVPTLVYFKKQLVKVEIALAKGKKLHDKREVTKEREAKREIARAVKN